MNDQNRQPLNPTPETKIIDDELRSECFAREWKPDHQATRQAVEVLRKYADALELGEVDLVAVRRLAEIGDVTKEGDTSRQFALTGIKSLEIITKL